MNGKISAVVCCLACEFGDVASGMHGTWVNCWLLVVVILVVETSGLRAGVGVLVLVVAAELSILLIVAIFFCIFCL